MNFSVNVHICGFVNICVYTQVCLFEHIHEAMLRNCISVYMYAHVRVHQSPPEKIFFLLSMYLNYFCL